jgi:tetratricopeptide (TPR) repeat protein
VGADTNSAQANYAYGMKRIYDSPMESVRAFYWASRIDPSSADAMYALWTARLIVMSDKDIVSYFSRTGKGTPAQIDLDSLIYGAYALNPFLFSSIDAALMRRTIEARVYLEFPKMPIGEQEEIVSGKMQAAEYRPEIAYSEGRFQVALRAYAIELDNAAHPVRLPERKKTKVKENPRQKAFIQMMKVAFAYELVDMHAKRARIFYHLHELDSASTEMTAAISILQAQDSGTAELPYVSKALFEQSLGMIYEHDRRLDLAREAYGRALQEDLSYYAAHSRIAGIELEHGDTAVALSEMNLAVELQPRDPALRYRYAEALLNARHDADAAQQLRKAIALDPYYGPPHLLLATIGDYENYTSDAIAEYQSYIALAARSDPQLPQVRARLAKLSASMASTQSH